MHSLKPYYIIDRDRGLKVTEEDASAQTEIYMMAARQSSHWHERCTNNGNLEREPCIT
jgi:hypothetical protein